VAETLGKYEIVRELGRGGMGVVYEGRDPDSSDRVAIKVLPAQLALDPVFRQRFIREVKTLERLDHPNIVRIRDSGHQQGALWYAMDFVDGTDLERLLRQEGRLDPLRATRIVHGVTTALAYSHAQNVVHRDIKPANILLTSDEGVKLTDFGIARMVDATRMTATAGVLGTVEYMSPEQAEGKVVDERTDVYSLGVVYYRAVTGKMPIDGATPTDIMVKIRTAQVSAPASWVPQLPRNVNDLILQMVEKDRSRRVLSAQALLRELDRVLRQLESGQQVSEEPIITSRGPEAAWWKNPWVIAFVLFLVAIFGWKALHRPPSPAGLLERAEALSSQGSYGEAGALLQDLLGRGDLADEQRDRARKLQEEVSELSTQQGVAARIWAAAKWAGRMKKPLVELKMILILIEELPGTPQAKEAAERLRDSIQLQELLKQLREGRPSPTLVAPGSPAPPEPPADGKPTGGNE